jgi:hypothetical protein
MDVQFVAVLSIDGARIHRPNARDRLKPAAACRRAPRSKFRPFVGYFAPLVGRSDHPRHIHDKHTAIILARAVLAEMKGLRSVETPLRQARYRTLFKSCRDQFKFIRQIARLAGNFS